MHVPDGFFDAPTSIATGAIAVGGVGLALSCSQRELRESGPALAGLTAAFVFAVQMVNFPVGAGTSGHLLGGTLAAALVGPWTAVLVMTTVLLVQGLLFADGGLTALGTNITLMGLVTVLAGYGVVRLLVRLLPRRSASVVPAAAVAAVVSVPVAAVCFTMLYAVGGAVPIPIGKLAAAMIGWHAMIGIGEAVITAAVLGAVVASRPDLVYAGRHLQPDLVLVDAAGNEAIVRPDQPLPVRSGPRLLGALLAAALVVGGVVSLLASGHPDGLEFVAGKLGFGDSAKPSVTGGSPLTDYGIYGIAGLDSWVGASLAGLAGVLITVVVGFLIGKLAERGAHRKTLAAAAGADRAEPTTTS